MIYPLDPAIVIIDAIEKINHKYLSDIRDELAIIELMANEDRARLLEQVSDMFAVNTSAVRTYLRTIQPPQPSLFEDNSNGGQ